MLAADFSWPLWASSGDAAPLQGAFDLDAAQVVTAVRTPYLFGYRPDEKRSNGRGVLVLGGGGYVQLMVGREGVAVAQWLAALGFHAFVLVHRFPNAATGVHAPLEDARRAMALVAQSGLAPAGLGVCGLSSGGHLGAALLAHSHLPASEPNEAPRPDFAMIGYGPISTNAVGRTVVPDKTPLEPPEKQAFYDAVQPDAQMADGAPPTFIVYSGSDPVVPVVNAYRLAEGITKAGGKVELHVFAEAPHGFALDTPGLPVSQWPGLCEAWMRQNSWIQ